MLNMDTFPHRTSVHCDCHLGIEFFLLMIAVGTFSSGRLPCSTTCLKQACCHNLKPKHMVAVRKMCMPYLLVQKDIVLNCVPSPPSILGSVDVPGNTCIPALYSPTSPYFLFHHGSQGYINGLPTCDHLR
jgi:hypothetical protein